MTDHEDRPMTNHDDRTRQPNVTTERDRTRQPNATTERDRTRQPNATTERDRTRPNTAEHDDRSADLPPTNPRLTRRRLVALAVPVALAGCFEEPEPEANVDDPGDGNDAPPADGPDEDDDDGDGGDAPTDADDSGAGSNGDDDDTDGGDDGDDDDGDDEDDDDGDDDGTPTPDRVDPEDAGVTVTDAEVTAVEDRGYWTDVTARLHVRNDGRFEYGTLEFRVDAYATRPNDPEREPVGFEYVTRRFGSGDRFSDGTRRFTVDVRFRSRNAALRAHPDWYEVDAAVRRAEPADD